jgi:hypothetical protein
VTKVKSTKNSDHVLHEFLPRETRECQPSSQRGDGEGNKFCVSSALSCIFWGGIANFEVLEIWEESDEIQDLPAGTPGLSESKESKSWREVSEALLNVRHEAGYLKIIYPKLLEVRECGEVTQRALAKAFTSKLASGGQADAESLDERK